MKQITTQTLYSPSTKTWMTTLTPVFSGYSFSNGRRIKNYKYIERTVELVDPLDGLLKWENTV